MFVLFYCSWSGYDPSISISEREERSVTNVLPTLISNYPKLRIVLEYVTTTVAVVAVKNAADDGALLADTLTSRLLVQSRNGLLDGARMHPNIFPYRFLSVNMTEKNYCMTLHGNIPTVSLRLRTQLQILAKGNIVPAVLLYFQCSRCC